MTEHDYDCDDMAAAGLAEQNRKLRAEVDRLRGELEQIRAEVQTEADCRYQAEVATLAIQEDRDARVAELEKALQPFAEAQEKWEAEGELEHSPGEFVEPEEFVQAGQTLWGDSRG
jgi:predicted RNase H-like nuclease (RuvC/YqgF family)